MKHEEKKDGFTLVEILTYIFLLSIIVSVASSFFIWMLKTAASAKAMRETADNAREAISLMAREIRAAESVYAPTSVFSVHPGQLSLETKNYLPSDETASYIDFYLCDKRICLKKESQDPLALTSENIEIDNLIFDVVGTISVQISLGARYKNPSDTPELDSYFTATTTVSVRNY